MLQPAADSVAGTYGHCCWQQLHRFRDYGGREGQAGKTTLPVLWFCLDVGQTRPMYWICEISGAEIQYYSSKFKDMYHIFVVEQEPLHVGVPQFRERLYISCNEIARSKRHDSKEEFRSKTWRSRRFRKGSTSCLHQRI